MLGSGQYLEEWKSYSKTLNSSGVLEKTVWLDIRGNHGKLYLFSPLAFQRSARLGN